MDSKIKVLYVEDEVTTQKFVEILLDDSAINNITTASDGKEALALYKQEIFDLVITDIMMPKMNGFELTKEIYKLNKNQVIIFLTAVDSKEDMIKIIQLGVKFFIEKPIDAQIFSSVLQNSIEFIKRNRQNALTNSLLEQYKSLIDSSSIVSKTDLKGNITYVNDNFCKVSGYSKEELLRKNHNIVRHPDMKQAIFKDLWHDIKNLKKTWQGVIKNQKKNGSHYWVQTTISPVLDTFGDIIEFVALRNDITTEQDYKLSLEKDLNIVTDQVFYNEQYEYGISTMVPIIKTDIDNKINSINEAFSRLSGYSIEDLKGINCSILRDEKHKLNRDCEEVAKEVKANKTVRKVFTNVDSNSNKYITDIFFYPIVDKDSNVVEIMQIMHDVTEIHQLNEDIINTQKEVVFTMGAIGETRSKETGLHVKRVAEYSYLLAKLSGLSEEDAQLLRQSSPMHDIGKVGIADSILNKPGKLTHEEFEIMKSHAELGYQMLRYSNKPILEASATIAYSHHEKWDGSGYPLQLVGKDIPIFGRITAVADVFDALGHDRCYKKAWEIDDILKLFKEQRGKHFDPILIDLFFNNLEKFLDIKNNLKDLSQ